MEQILSGLLIPKIEKFTQAVSKAGGVQPGYSLSTKISRKNLFGIEEEILLIGQASWPRLPFPDPESWARLRLKSLHGLLNQPEFNPDDLAYALSECRAEYDSPMPSALALLHATIDAPWVCFCEPFDLMAAFCLADSTSIFQDWPPEAGNFLAFDPNLHHLAREIHSLAQPGSTFVLQNRGVLLSADDLEALQAKLEALTDLISHRLDSLTHDHPANETPSSQPIFLPALRAKICALRGRPLVLHLDASPEMGAFANASVCAQVSEMGIPFPGLASYTGLPTVLSEGDSVPALVPESKAGTTVLLIPGVGAITAGNAVDEASRAGAIFQIAAQALIAASQVGGIRLLNPDALEKAAQWEIIRAPERLPFSGEVALVTGSASGIGRAVVGSLLQRGCAVVGLDINPSITSTFDHPCYQGMICDVFDEAAICETMRSVGLHFGGLDILVLNAGLFPGGCSIEKMTLSEFTKVININFVANMVILREAYPMLRIAPRYGRVVIVGSKNMRAPGPGAAAYSTSKAALTQLARVAALEWGSERIRVNVIHPDSVFDTALYTEEVLQARAKHYGMTVEQYKKRNLLKTEITSHDVAELTAEMCGPLFRHMTGGQIQFDGGNDRTI